LDINGVSKFESEEKASVDIFQQDLLRPEFFPDNLEEEANPRFDEL